MNTYFTQKNSLCAAALGAMALALLPSCQDEDFGYTAEEIRYAKNFTEKYGEIAPDKNWDLSTYGTHYGDEAGAGTRAAGEPGDKLYGYYDAATQNENMQFVKKGWWEVPKNTLKWMEKALAEGKDNRYLGSNFILQLPANDFAIVPIFQGHSGINSELEVKINGYQITKVWGRSEDILVNDRTMTESEAANLAYPTTTDPTTGNIKTANNTYNSTTGKYEPDNKWHTLGYYAGVTQASQADQETGGRGVEYNDGITEYVYPTYPCWMEWAHRVMSKPIYFRKNKISTSYPYMYLSLHNTGKQVIDHKDGVERIWDYNIWLDERGPNVWTKVGNRLTSINPAKRMLALNIPTADRPNKDALPKIHEGQGDNYREPSQVMIIACEDADGVASDNDVNDVAFLIIGYPNVPTVIPTEEVIKKRYMCEDLGATDDFDFNDIVIDVTQTMQYQLVTTPAGMEDYDFNDQFNGDNVTGVEIESMQPLDGKNGTTDTRKQTAKITHVCGTLPITARVGNYIFPKIEDPTDQYATRCALRGDGTMASKSAGAPTRATGEKIGWNPNEEKVIPDNSWDPKANNITIYVDWSKSKCPTSSNVNAGKVDNTNNPYAEGTGNFADFAEGNKVWVSFPRPGEVPYIIATDQDVPWMLERQDIPAEWVDSRADITARNGKEADPGYGMYMENYNGSGRQEVAIWSGNVTGLGGTTGVVMEPGSPEILGIAAAGDGYTDPDELATGTKQTEGHYAHKLIVYTEQMNGQIGAINLCYNDNGEWIPLTTQQPDGYSQGPVEGSSYGFGTEGLCRTEIYLTNEQYVKIVGDNGARHGFDGKGLVVVSQTNGLVIRKISMEVARTYNQGPYYGYLVNIDRPINASGEGQGTIKAIDQCARYVDSEAEKADANAEASRTSVPFDQRRFDSGDLFTLSAIGKKGYALKNWVVVDNVNNTTDRTITAAQYTFTCGDEDSHRRTISAEFVEAKDPALVFQPGETKSIDITIEKGQTYIQKLSSLYWSTTVDHYGENGDVVTVTSLANDNVDVNGTSRLCHRLSIVGKEVGTTEFVVYTRDGYLQGDQTQDHFGVSDELKVKVKVVEPVAEGVELRSATHFYKWDKMAQDAKVVSRGTTQDILNTEVEASDKGYALPMIGCSDNDDLTYADLNNSDYITIYVAAGYDQPLLFFNVANDADKVDFLANNNRYCTAINIDDGSMKYVIDLKKVRGEHGYYSVLKFIGTDWGKSCKITDVRLDKYNSAGADAFENDQNTMCSVGVNMNQSVGKVTITTDGIFYQKNGEDTYSPIAEKSIQCNTPNAIYVTKNTVVTFTAPQNPDYNWDGWSNGSKDYTRTGPVDNVNYNPYLTYTLKEDPELALTDPSQATIVLNYATPYVDIKWSKASGSGDVKFKGYDYATEVNIWRNSEENSHHMRAQETNFNNKKITMYVDATDTHRSASIELDVTVRDYVDNNYGYRVPATGNEVLARMIKDALHNTTKNIQIMVRRGTSAPATIKVKNATGEWDKTLKDNGNWTSEVASHNDTWEGQDAVSFTFTISASDFSTYFDKWESKLVFYGFDDWNGINDGGTNQRGVWVKAVD